ENAGVFDIGRRKRTRAAEANPCGPAFGRAEDAFAERIGELVQHLKLSAHNAVGLGISGALRGATAILALDEAGHIPDDLARDFVFALYGDLVAEAGFRLAMEDAQQQLRELDQRALKHTVEAIAKVRVPTALERERACDP